MRSEPQDPFSMQKLIEKRLAGRVLFSVESPDLALPLGDASHSLSDPKSPLRCLGEPRAEGNTVLPGGCICSGRHVGVNGN
jgi:hypothetical protein